MLADEADNPGFLLLLEQAEKEVRGGRPDLATIYLDKAVTVHPEDISVRVLRGRARVKAGMNEGALEDSSAVLVDFNKPTCAGALIVQAQALYALGNFEHALVSHHRASRQEGLLMSEREEIQVGIQRTEEAVCNSLGEAAGLFFQNIGEVLHRVPSSFLGVSWFKLKSLVSEEASAGSFEEQSAGSRLRTRQRDRKFLNQIAEEKIYLEDLMSRLSCLEGGDAVAGEAEAALDFIQVQPYHRHQHHHHNHHHHRHQHHHHNHHRHHHYHHQSQQGVLSVH